MRQMMWVVVALVMMVGLVGTVQAQAGGGGRGNFDPAQFRQQMMDRFKEQLGASDDEWKAIQPKLEKVMEVRQASFAGFGRGRGGGGGQDAPQTPIAKASADLRAALENKDTPADELQKKLAALREARETARKDLATAQKDLKDLLTARQEAVMVVNGMLE
jgi:hypothetical protein